jgi:hypothetical protein
MGREAVMDKSIYQERLRKCILLMEGAGLDLLLLAKPANMAYLTGDGRLCAFAMITKNGKVALGVPKTDVEPEKSSESGWQVKLLLPE